MKMICQLWRQPIFTVAAAVFLISSSAFLCVTFGLYHVSCETAKNIDSEYITIAVPGNATEAVEWKDDEGNVLFTYDRNIFTEEVLNWVASLQEKSSTVKGIFQQQYVNAYIPSVSTIISTSEPETYGKISDQASGYKDCPYNMAVFVARVESIEINEWDGFWYMQISGAIEETVLLHPQYVPRKKIKISITFSSEEAVYEAGVEIGKRYLFYGESYVDSDLSFRVQLASSIGNGVTVDDIDWKNMRYDISPIEGVEESKNWGAEYVIDEASGMSILLVESEVKKIDSASMSYAYRSANIIDEPGYEEYNRVLSAQCDVIPPVMEIKEDLETALSSPEGEAWRELLDQMEISLHSVPIIGTDQLESMFSFQQEDAMIIQGRGFTEEEYATGARVCIISENMAVESGLSIGDQIEFNYYWGDFMGCDFDHFVTAQRYNYLLGFEDKGQIYEIVGLYRQADLWESSPYGFTSNTVFVPNESITVDTVTKPTGLFCTVVLKNGGISEMKDMVSDAGYPEDLFLYFDGGFEVYAKTLSGFQRSVWELLLGAIVIWMIMLGVYVILAIVKRQKKNAALMMIMGTGKGRTAMNIFRVSYLPPIISIIVGTGCGCAIFRTVTDLVFSASMNEMDSAFSASGELVLEQIAMQIKPDPIVLCGVLQAIVYAVIIGVVCRNMVKKNR